MSRMDGNVTDFAPHTRHGNDTGACQCWVCQTNVTERAAFCHTCGSIQPVRNMNHFQRLGMSARYDLEHETLTAHYTALQRIFTQDRLQQLGPRQKKMVSEHQAALETAYGVLSDPLKRAEYLLSLLDPQDATSDAANLAMIEGETFTLRRELEKASSSADIDRVACKARHGMEVALRDLAQAFRSHTFATVSAILTRFRQLEDIAAQARDRRVTV